MTKFEQFITRLICLYITFMR